MMKCFKKIVITLAFIFTVSRAQSFTLIELSFFSADCGHPVLLIPDSLYSNLDSVRIVVSITATDRNDETTLYYDTVRLDNTDYFEYLGNINFTTDSSGIRHGFRFIYTDYTPISGTMTLIDLQTLYEGESVLWSYSLHKSCMTCPTCISRLSMYFTYTYLPWRIFNGDYPFSGYGGNYASLSSEHKEVIATVLNWITNRSATVTDYLNMLNPDNIGNADVPEAFCSGSSAGFNSCLYQNRLLGIAQYVNEQLMDMGPDDENAFYALQDDANNFSFTQCLLSSNYIFHLQSTDSDTGFIFIAMPFGQAGLPAVITKVVFDNGTAYSAMAYSYNFSSTDGINYMGGGEFEFVNGFKQAVNEEDFLAFPRLTITADGATTFCQGNSVTLTAQFGSGDYYWSPAGDNDSSMTVTDAGGYTLQIQDEDGCYADAADTIVVTVHENPVADAGRDTSICLGQSVLIGNAASGGTSPYTYAWSPGITLNDSTIAQPAAAPSDTTEYIFTITDINGCTAENYVIVNISSPVADAGSDRKLCSGEEFVLGGAYTASKGQYPYLYYWENMAGDTLFTETNPSLVADTSSSYQVLVRDNIGCSARDTITLTVFPGLTADAGRDTLLTIGGTITLGGSTVVTGGSGTITYEWSPAQWLDDSTATHPVCTPLSPAVYQLSVHDTAGCWAFDAVSVMFSPVNMRQLGAYAAVALDSIIMTDSSSAIGDVESRYFISDNLHIEGSDTVDNETADLLGETLDSVIADIDLLAADTISRNLGGRTLTSGIYRIDTSAFLDGTLTLSGNDSSYFVFDIDEDFEITVGSQIELEGVPPSKVFFNTAGSVTAGSDAVLYGSFLTSGDFTTEGFTGAVSSFSKGKLRGGGPVFNLQEVVVYIASINISLAGNKRTIPSDYFGINTEPVIEKESNGTYIDFQNENFNKLLTTLHPKILRIWNKNHLSDWNTGWFLARNLFKYRALSSSSLPLNMTNFPNGNNCTIDQYLTWAQYNPTLQNHVKDYRFTSFGTGASLMYTLNILNSSPDYQMKWIDYSHDMGCTPAYVEIGNENYLNGKGNLQCELPGAKDYLTLANSYLDRIHQYNIDNGTSIKVGVTAAADREDDGSKKVSLESCRAGTWNAVLDLPNTCTPPCSTSLHLNTGDALIFHLYPNAQWTKPTGSTVLPVWSDADFRTMMAQPFLTIRHFSANEANLIPSSPSGVEAWITEFNLSDHTINENGNNGIAIHGTWAHGLFLASYILNMLEEPKITHITPHSFLSDAGHSMYFNDNNGFDKMFRFTPPPSDGVNPSLITDQWEKTSEGDCVTLISKAFENCTAVEKINFKSFISIPGLPDPLKDATYNFPLLYGWVFYGNNANQNEVIILNFTKYSQSISPARLKGVFPSGVLAYEQVAAPSILKDAPLLYVVGDFTTAHYIPGSTSYVFDGYSYTNSKVPRLSNTNQSAPCSGIVTLAPYSITRIYTFHSPVTITANKTTACVTDAVNVSVTGGDVTNWSVSPSGGTVLTGGSNGNNSAMIKFAASGTFTVTAYVRQDDCAGWLSSMTGYSITIYVVAPQPLDAIAVTDPSSCSGKYTLQTNLHGSVPADEKYWWSPTEGLFNGSNQSAINGSTIYASPLFSDNANKYATPYSCTGIYPVTVHGVTEQCYDMVYKKILPVIKTPPLAQPDPDNGGKYPFMVMSVDNGSGFTSNFKSPFCSSSYFNLKEVNGSNTLSNVNWYIDGVLNSDHGSTTNNLTLNQTSFINVTYTTSNANFCPLADEARIQIDPQISLKTIVPKLKFCKDEDITIEVEGTDVDDYLGTYYPGTYHWSTPSSPSVLTVSSSTKSAIFVSGSSGSYSFNVYGTRTTPSGSPCYGSSSNVIRFPFHIDGTSTTPVVKNNGTAGTTFSIGHNCTIDLTAENGEYFEWQVIDHDNDGIGDGWLSNFTGPSVTAKVGYYSVKSVNFANNAHGCCGTKNITVEEDGYSACIGIPGGGERKSLTETYRALNTLTMYPNPSDGTFAIALQNNSKGTSCYSLNIVDLLGTKYFDQSGNIDSYSSVTIPVKINLPQGMYVINAIIGNKSFSSKIVILQ